MKITVLLENNSRIDNYLTSEPALALLIETQDKKILFDTGYSDVFLKNAEKLNINLNSLSDIVISHGHNDHTGGLRYLSSKNKIKLTAHPNIFDKKIDSDGSFYGCPVSKEELKNSYILNLSLEACYLSKDVLFLGDIEGNISSDVDDSALVVISEKGLFIITGCSHAGIINIIKYAKKITGINKVFGVMGGFHLLDLSESEVEKISDYFNSENIDFIAPCHCCDLKSKIILSRKNNVIDVCTGDVFQF